MRLRFTRSLLSAVTLLFASSAASAQYASDFEALSASASGAILTGQDGYYIPAGTISIDYNAFTYAGNSLGIPANPNGGTQFVAGTGPGTLPAGATFARAQRDMSYGAGTGVWTAGFDICATFVGPALPTTQNLGSFSTQPFPGGQSFIALARWVDVNTAMNWNADYVWFDMAGTQLTESVSDPAFQNLDVNKWYHWETDFDLDTNEIVEVRLTDIALGTTATNNPVGRYMFGGAAGGTIPTGFRFFAGGTVDGNTLAFDNPNIRPEMGPIGMPDPGCMPLANSIGTVPQVGLSGSGLAGEAVMAQLTNGKPSEFGYWISGPNAGTIPAGCGIVCIGGPQYRYNSAPSGHLYQFDAMGISQTVGGAGPNVLPTNGSFAPVPAVLVGETRSFQGWYRDAGCSVMGQQFNFSNSVRVTFN